MADAQLDDERAILGYLLAHPDLFEMIVYGSDEAEPIGALDFVKPVHRQLFSLMRLHYAPNGDIEALMGAFPAVVLSNLGGMDWLLEMMLEAPDEIGEALGRMFSQRAGTARDNMAAAVTNVLLKGAS